MRENGVLDMWGTDPGTQCTGNYDYGCFRVAGAGGNILNPIQSGLVRSVNSVKFRYGRVEVRAKMPIGKWIWPVRKGQRNLSFAVVLFFILRFLKWYPDSPAKFSPGEREQAIWMMPVHYQYGGWPASGEIDIVESRGNDPSYPAGGYNKVASTLHWGKVH